VVLAAGAIHSPAILLRTGVDAPGVGDNLHDHPSFPIPIARHRPADVSRLPITTAVTEGDVQLLPMEYVDAEDPHSGLLLHAVMHVHSRGTVRLASDDPHVQPVVDFRMLTDERDWNALAACIDRGEAVLDHEAMRSVGTPRTYDRSLAGARAALGHYFHAAGTCAMGTVVDPWCRVIGYDALTVCDASVMPSLPRAGPHLPTVMIAERIAAFTSARWRRAGR
jgi:choline dehydrogenase-like flavoprotein